MSTETTNAAVPPGPAGTSVSDLVTRARNGDQQAWDALVELYAPLIWSICRAHRLSEADADGVGQSVWQHLVRHIDQVGDPAALAGWLATTTRRECLRIPRTVPRGGGYCGGRDWGPRQAHLRGPRGHESAAGGHRGGQPGGA